MILSIAIKKIRSEWVKCITDHKMHSPKNKMDVYSVWHKGNWGTIINVYWELSVLELIFIEHYIHDKNNNDLQLH